MWAHIVILAASSRYIAETFVVRIDIDRHLIGMGNDTVVGLGQIQRTAFDWINLDARLRKGATAAPSIW
jgi:hypothetical protein